MSRRDEYNASMLRDLGSEYYETVRGEAVAAAAADAAGAARAQDDAAGPERAGQDAARHGRWRVQDVMSADVITADKNMPYKQVARLLADNDLSAVPVISGGRRVLGMVSEADVLRREERTFSRLSAGLPRRTRHEREQATALTAAGLMTSPAITIHPDAPLGAAARLMNAHHVRRLPVVSPSGELIGVVSRQDLLRVFLRPDAEIAAEIAESLGRLADGGQLRAAVSVADGEVVLTGEAASVAVISGAVTIASGVAGVVAVASKLTVTAAMPAEPPAAGS